MNEESERMLLLLKELAVLKESEKQATGALPSSELPSPSERRRKRKEIAREIKRIARAPNFSGYGSTC